MSEPSYQARTFPAEPIKIEEKMIVVDLARETVYTVLGYDRFGKEKRYFLKVTKRGGLVLI